MTNDHHFAFSMHGLTQGGFAVDSGGGFRMMARMAELPRSLTTRTLLQVAMAVTLILVATTAATYWTVLKRMEQQNLAALSDYAAERAKRENAIFAQAEENLALMKALFLEGWPAAAADATLDARFEAAVAHGADGAWRSRREAIRRGIDPTVWVRAGAAMTPELKRLIMFCGDLCRTYLPAWKARLNNLYVSSPLEFNVGIALAELDWVWQVEADFDQNNYGWGRAGLVAENPERRAIWTEVIPDVIGATEEGGGPAAYVTLCQPVDAPEGRHLATFHQDIGLNDLIKNTAQSERPGVEHVIFRRDGAVIASTRVNPEQLASGAFRMATSGDPLLARLFTAAQGHAGAPWAGYDADGDSYLALSRLEGPDWIFASVLPGPELRRQASTAARHVLWTGLAALALVLPLLAFILRRQIARPLRHLLHMTQRMAEGDTAARVGWQSHDELGQVAEAFNRMAHNVAARDASLNALNQELESRIVERTEGLRQSEERFSCAFHGSHALIAILEAGDGRIVDVNETFLSTFGYAREEVIGRRPVELTLWTYLNTQETLLKACTEQGFARDLEAAVLTRGGEHRVLSLSADCVTIGTAPCILAVGADITDRKRAEEEMRHALAREKELNQLKDNFVAMVSHEFRTPLEVIMSSTDILHRYLERVTPEQRAAQLATIQDAVRRMSTMMEEVLLLGRVEAGRLTCHPQDIHLPAWCRRLLAEIGPSFPDPHGITLELADVPPMVMADETLLRHIFTNLLSNAVKYSEAGATVRFAVRQEGSDAVFTIKDRGLGIPAADQPHLFDGFHRGRNVGTRPGTGLGLVIARRCVLLHGGSIDFVSAEGKGTTFTVRLPLFEEGTATVAATVMASVAITATAAATADPASDFA